MKALLAETKIEGKHRSSRDLALDPASTVEDAVGFGLQAESALGRCNVDKGLALDYLDPKAPKSCPWWRFGKCQ